MAERGIISGRDDPFFFGCSRLLEVQTVFVPQTPGREKEKIGERLKYPGMDTATFVEKGKPYRFAKGNQLGRLKRPTKREQKFTLLGVVDTLEQLRFDPMLEAVKLFKRADKAGELEVMRKILTDIIGVTYPKRKAIESNVNIKQISVIYEDQIPAELQAQMAGQIIEAEALPLPSMGVTNEGEQDEQEHIRQQE